MSTHLLPIALLMVAPTAAPVDQKVLIGGHGHAMVDTQSLRAHLGTVEEAAFDGVILNVNPDWQHRDPGLRLHRNWTWGGRPARTAAGYSLAVADLVEIAARATRLKHNLMLYTLRTAKDFDSRAANIDWLDEDWSIVANNAFVAGTICRKGHLDGIWFDLETADGGPFNWFRGRKSTASYEHYTRTVRRRGREWMAAACRAKPDIAVMISHGYGDIRAFGGDSESLRTNPYGLMPAFIDGLLEGCSPDATVVHGGEATYSHMTYAAFKHYVDVQRIQTARLCGVPDRARRHFRYATAVWPDFRSDRDGFDLVDHARNHYSPEKLRHALHNAMAASDRYVWTWDMQVHWWPMVNHVERTPSPPEHRHVFPASYQRALANARDPADLDWTPGLNDRRTYPSPPRGGRQLESIGSEYDVISELAAGWQFALDPDDTDHWGVEFTEHETFPGRWEPIALGDWWENRGHPYDGLAWYRRSFTVPAAARDKRIYALIAGVKDSAQVFVTRPSRRGTQVGKITRLSPTLIDVTEAIDPGATNVLAIRVQNRAGAGGLVGPVWIVAGKQRAGKHAYLVLRGSDEKTWGQWVKSPRFQDTRTFHLGDEFTVAARLRAPASGSYHARVWAGGDSASWDLVLTPGRVSLGSEAVPVDVERWHEYRVVVRQVGDEIEQLLSIDGAQRARIVAPHRQRKPIESLIGFGSPWITIAQSSTAPRTRLEVDWFRYANRAILPSGDRSVFEAAPRVEGVWDASYDGDALPQAVGWKYWPEGDPTSISRIAFPDRYLLRPEVSGALQRAAKIVVADWSRGFVPRDLPRLAAQGEQARLKLLPGGARLTIPASLDEPYDWPGATLTRLAITDWSGYAGLAIRLSNPADHPVEIAVKAIDQDRDSWYHYFTVRAHETAVIRIPIDDLKQKINPARMFAIGFNCRKVTRQQTFLFSPVYLLKRAPPPGR